MEQRRSRGTKRFGIGGTALLAVLTVVLAGTTAAFAAGAFETNDSGFDTSHDLSERGVVTDEPATTTGPSAVGQNEVEAEHVEPGEPAATGAPGPVLVVSPLAGTEVRGHEVEAEVEAESGDATDVPRVDNSGPGSASSGRTSDDAADTADDHGRHGGDDSSSGGSGSGSGGSTSGSGGSGRSGSED